MTSMKAVTDLPDEHVIAKRYAQALFSIGEEQGLTQAFFTQLTGVTAVLAADDGRLAGFLSPGRLSPHQQKSLIKEIFAGQIHPLLENTLCLLLDKGRGGYLPALPVAYQQLLDEKAGILPVTVVCSYPLSSEQQAALSAAIVKISGKDIRLDQEVDASLIGGLKLVIGDTVYDGSLNKQLDKLTETLHNP